MKGMSAPWRSTTPRRFLREIGQALEALRPRRDDEQRLVMQDGQGQAVIGQEHVGTHHREVSQAARSALALSRTSSKCMDLETHVLARARQGLRIDIQQVASAPSRGPTATISVVGRDTYTMAAGDEREPERHEEEDRFPPQED